MHTNYSLMALWLLMLLLVAAWPASQAHRYAHASSQPTTLGVHIVRNPESAVAPKGDEVVFECELNLQPERPIEWRFRPSTAGDSKHYQYLRRENGYNVTGSDVVSQLRIFVSPDTLGDYQCLAWYGSAAIASIAARLSLVSITIDNSNGYSRNAVRLNVAPKNCLLLRCGSVTSNPPPVWSFYRNDDKLPQIDVSPSSNGALILDSVTAKDSGTYSCSAMNSITGVEVKLPNRIEIRVDYQDRTPPYFLKTPPIAMKAKPGETVILECPGVGSPPPSAVWSSPNVANINHNRTKILPYGLQISDVVAEDQGSYICRLDNGIKPPLVHTIKLNVLERPVILRGPAETLTNESDPLELECSATGNPQPNIYWLINGEDASLDNETIHEDRRLVIKHVQKRHAGIVQCFAKNEVGETSEASLLQVNPTQIQGEYGSGPLGNVPTRPPNEHSGYNTRKTTKKKHKSYMIPPSKPNVTRLSDDSVMLRWYVPKNDGLPIQFFKVQYRMLGDNARKIPRENWQTTNEDIPYGKRDRHFEGVKNFTSSVTGLKPDRNYRFRILAVYSNNDNKEGNTSAKFFLQRGSTLGPTKATLPAPILQSCDGVSETEVMLHWTLPPSAGSTVDGFYAYYRPTSSAGEYLKVTVDGMHTNKFKIDLLEPGTSYEFKLQSFNAMAASDFSAIVPGRTQKAATTPSPIASVVITTTKTNEEDNSIYPVVAGAVGGGFLLLVAAVAVCLCLKRWKNSTPDDDNKPQLDHIQADFVTPSVLGVSPHHKAGHRLNGVIPHMNITTNPLAQEADKNRNVMELHYMTNSTAPQANNRNSTSAATPTTAMYKSDGACDEVDGEGPPNGSVHHQAQRSSSSCETLEASDGVTTAAATATTTTASSTPPLVASQTSNGTVDASSPLSKPLPPLPTKANNNNATTAASHYKSPTGSASAATKKPTNARTTTPGTAASHHASTATHSSATPPSKLNTHHLTNSQASHGGHQGLHHAQPYHPGGGQSGQATPTLMHAPKRDYHGGGGGGHPPPVPPHQNNNHHPATHHAQQTQHHQQVPHHGGQPGHHHLHHSNPYQSPPPPLTPSMEHNRRTLERSARNLHYGGGGSVSPPGGHHHDNMNIDGLPTRIPSLRRTRRTSGNANNNNGGVGIPVMPGSPRVQRSPMPARAMIKRNRLGSHNDNISSGSLNSIEV